MTEDRVPPEPTEEIQRLIEIEVAARERARVLELDPNRQQEAAGLFGRASLLREERLRLARSCGIA